MCVLDNMKLMFVDYSAGSSLGIETQERHELVVERYCDAHVPDSDLDVIDDGLHVRGLTAELSAAGAVEWAWHFIFQVCAPAIC
jgi:hypothetical protein